MKDASVLNLVGHILISRLDDEYIPTEEKKVYIASEPCFIHCDVQGLDFFVLEGGQVVPAGIEIENYDISKINVLSWYGPHSIYDPRMWSLINPSLTRGIAVKHLPSVPCAYKAT